jgi:hypothetical protein
MAHSCIVERTMVITNCKLNLATGEKTNIREETVTRNCGTPLFGEIEQKLGVCRSCIMGWSVPGNCPTERGLKQIQDALARV